MDSLLRTRGAWSYRLMSYVFTVVLLFSLVFISPAVSQTAREPVKIGAIFPLTGLLADSGRYPMEALKMAQDEINRGGGIVALGGRPIEFVFADDQGKPELATREAERLVKTNSVVALTGTYGSATGLAASAVAERLKVPWLQVVGLADLITQRGFKYTFRNKPNISMITRDRYRFMAYLSKSAHKDIKNIALLVEDSAYGKDGASIDRKMAPSLAYTIVADESFRQGSSDLTPQLSKIKAANAQAILAWNLMPEGLIIMRTMDILEMHMPFLPTTGGCFGQAMLDLGTLSENLACTSAWSTDLKLPGVKETNERYRKLFGRDMNDDASSAYSGAYILKEALERAKSTDAETLRNAMAHIQISRGPAMIVPTENSRINFGADGQFHEGTLIVMQVQNNKYVTVWPEAGASGKLRIPWTW